MVLDPVGSSHECASTIPRICSSLYTPSILCNTISLMGVLNHALKMLDAEIRPILAKYFNCDYMFWYLRSHFIKIIVNISIMIPRMNKKKRLIVSCVLIAAFIALISNSSKEDESNLVQTTVHIRKPVLPIVPKTDTINWTTVDQQRQGSDGSNSDDRDDTEKFNVSKRQSTRGSSGSTLLRLMSRLLEMSDKKNNKKAKQVKDKDKRKVRNFESFFIDRHRVWLTQVSPEIEYQKTDKERTDGACKCAYCD